MYLYNRWLDYWWCVFWDHRSCISKNTSTDMQSAGADKFPPQLATFHQSSWSDSLSENRIYIYIYALPHKKNKWCSFIVFLKQNKPHSNNRNSNQWTILRVDSLAEGPRMHLWNDEGPRACGRKSRNLPMESHFFLRFKKRTYSKYRKSEQPHMVFPSLPVGSDSNLRWWAFGVGAIDDRISIFWSCLV